MTTIELARKALEIVKGGWSFNCNLYAYEGGACGDGWSGDGELYLSEEQVMYLISSRTGDDKIYENMVLEEVDTDSLIYDLAEENAFPDGSEEEWDIGGNCEELEGFLNAWDVLICKIEDGEITEECIDRWLEYFDDSSNFDMDIDEWVEDGEETL